MHRDKGLENSEQVMENIILNMSGALLDEGLDSSLEDVRVVDLSALDSTNCYCDASAQEAIRKAVGDVPAGAVHWIDTGDYHYLSRFFLEKAAAELRKPFALVLFDHHPDMQEAAFEGVLSCGGWARDAFTGIGELSQVLMAGINPDLEIEILDLVFDGVLSVTEEDFRHTGDGLSKDVLEMISLLEPGIPVYLSIDKDVLTADHARTDWDQGSMTLAQLEAAILTIYRSHPVLGVDVCGGITRGKGATDSDFELNLATDVSLSKLFGNLAFHS